MGMGWQKMRRASFLFACLAILPAASGFASDSDGAKPGRLRPESRIQIYRYMHADFAKIVRPIPACPKGFIVKAGEIPPGDETALGLPAGCGAEAGRPGDRVQVTDIVFRDKEIIFDFNGGSRPPKKSAWSRIRSGVSVGGVPIPETEKTTVKPPPEGYKVPGMTIVLDFGRPVPDTVPDELKKLLSPYLDFSKDERSAAVQWLDSLPPKFRDAVKGKYVILGMDQEMVQEALAGKSYAVEKEKDGKGGITLMTWTYKMPSQVAFVEFHPDENGRLTVSCIRLYEDASHCRESSKAD